MREVVANKAVETQIESFLLGKVLTIIDASYPDTVQRDAVKSLVKEKFHSQVDWLLDRNSGQPGEDPVSDESVSQTHEYGPMPPETDMYVLPKEKLLSIIELENAWEHVGRTKSEYTDAYELLLPLGKDHTMKLIVDKEAVTDSGFFEKV